MDTCFGPPPCAMANARGGVTLIYRDSPLFQLENEKVQGPNLITFELVVGEKELTERWFVVGAYMAAGSCRPERLPGLPTGQTGGDLGGGNGAVRARVRQQTFCGAADPARAGPMDVPSAPKRLRGGEAEYQIKA